MGTKNNPDEFDCYDRILPDEPFFTLRAADPEAPAVVRAWATSMAERLNNHRLARGQDPTVIARKIARAFDCANEMEKWRLLPKAVRPSRPVENPGEILQFQLRTYLASVHPYLEAFKKWNSKRPRTRRFQATLNNCYRYMHKGQPFSEPMMKLLANFHGFYVTFASDTRVVLPVFPMKVFIRYMPPDRRSLDELNLR